MSETRRTDRQSQPYSKLELLEPEPWNQLPLSSPLPSPEELSELSSLLEPPSLPLPLLLLSPLPEKEAFACSEPEVDDADDVELTDDET
jgi:hypothetical protein